MSFQDFLDESDDDFIKEDTESRLGESSKDRKRPISAASTAVPDMSVGGVPIRMPSYSRPSSASTVGAMSRPTSAVGPRSTQPPSPGSPPSMLGPTDSLRGRGASPTPDKSPSRGLGALRPPSPGSPPSMLGPTDSLRGRSNSPTPDTARFGSSSLGPVATTSGSTSEQRRDPWERTHGFLDSAPGVRLGQVRPSSAMRKAQERPVDLGPPQELVHSDGEKKKGKKEKKEKKDKKSKKEKKEGKVDLGDMEESWQKKKGKKEKKESMVDLADMEESWQEKKVKKEKKDKKQRKEQRHKVKENEEVSVSIDSGHSPGSTSLMPWESDERRVQKPKAEPGRQVAAPQPTAPSRPSRPSQPRSGGRVRVRRFLLSFDPLGLSVVWEKNGVTQNSVIRVDPSDMEGLRRKVLARRLIRKWEFLEDRHLPQVDSLLERLALRVLPVYRVVTPDALGIVDAPGKPKEGHLTLPPGVLILVVERTRCRDGWWLRLACGRGWVPERQHDLEACKKCIPSSEEATESLRLMRLERPKSSVLERNARLVCSQLAKQTARSRD